MPLPPANRPAPAVLLQLGFRIFFLVAAVFAVLAMGLWAGAWFAGWPVGAVAAVQWHAHEMLFGYAMAVIAGFLLTAVPNWTGLPTASGMPLAALVAAWLAARVLMAAGPGLLPAAAAADLAFNLGLLLAVAVPVLRARQWRQAGILAKLVLLGVANAAFYGGELGLWTGAARPALSAALLLIVALVLTIGGRVLPGFIERGVDVPVHINDRPLAARASLACFLVFFVAELLGDAPRLAAVAAAGVAGFNASRLAAWHTPALWRRPLLWGLYLAMLAIEAGFILYALAPWFAIPRTLAMHALATGGIGLATLAMMARVSLGHTGRDIRQPPTLLAPALALLAAGVLARVLLPLLLPASYALGVGLAQACWMLAFSLFAVAYLPMLASPRVDGRPG